MRQGVFSQILFKGVNETIFNHYREKVDKRMKKLMDRLNKQFKSIDNAWIEDTYFKLLNGNIQQIDYMRAGILSQKKSIYELYVEKICRLVLVNYVSLSMPNLRKYPFMEVATQTVRYKPGCGVFVTVDPLLE